MAFGVLCMFLVACVYLTWVVGGYQLIIVSPVADGTNRVRSYIARACSTYVCVNLS